MPIAANAGADINAALATTCTQITWGSGVQVAWFTCETSCYLVYADNVNDGDARPANRGFLIPAGLAWPIRNIGKKTFIAASSGAPVGHLLPEGS